MLLLGQAGLRRSEVCALRYGDLEELRRHPDPRRRAAVAPRAAEQTGWVVHVRHPKRGRARAVDLTEEAVEALRAWTQSRPEAATDHLFLSLARNRPPGPLVPGRSTSLSPPTPSGPGCPRTAAPRTSCATPSAPCWPTVARDSRSSPSSPGMPTCGRRRAMCPSHPSVGPGRLGRPSQGVDRRSGRLERRRAHDLAHPRLLCAHRPRPHPPH